MKATYNLPGNFLQEIAEMEKPIKPDIGDFVGRSRGQEEYAAVNYLYNRANDKYNAHIASLRAIQCSEECKSVFRDGGVYEQGKDYEVGKKHPDETDVAAPELMAFPLSQPVQEDDWAALFLLIHMNAQEYKDLLGNNHPGLPNNEQWHKAMINELKKHFTLQRKQDTAKAGD